MYVCARAEPIFYKKECFWSKGCFEPFFYFLSFLPLHLHFAKDFGWKYSWKSNSKLTKKFRYCGSTQLDSTSVGKKFAKAAFERKAFFCRTSLQYFQVEPFNLSWLKNLLGDIFGSHLSALNGTNSEIYFNNYFRFSSLVRVYVLLRIRIYVLLVLHFLSPFYPWKDSLGSFIFHFNFICIDAEFLWKWEICRHLRWNGLIDLMHFPENNQFFFYYNLDWYN